MLTSLFITRFTRAQLFVPNAWDELRGKGDESSNSKTQRTNYYTKIMIATTTIAVVQYYLDYLGVSVFRTSPVSSDATVTREEDMGKPNGGSSE